MPKLYVTPTPIGNLGDITERSLAALRLADIIAAEDTRRTVQLLNHFEIKAKIVSYHRHNEISRGEELINRMIDDDLSVALVTDAGTPCISDPGCTLVRLCREKNIEVVALPGASAVITALSVSGMDFISFAFLGFFPRDKKEAEKTIQNIENSDIDAFVMFDSPNRIINTLKYIEKYFTDIKVFVINDITKFYERSYHGKINEVINQMEVTEKTELGEYTFIIQKVKKTDEKGIDEVEKISIEAVLVDIMLKERCTLKEATQLAAERNCDIRKNDAYKASLTLKKLFE